MIRQPINIVDMLDHHGRSFHRFYDGVVFEPTEKLSTLFTFTLNNYLTQCDFDQALIICLPTKPKEQWVLFSSFKYLQEFLKSYKLGDVIEKTAKHSPIAQQRVTQLFSNKLKYKKFKTLCSAAPYILVHLQPRKRTDRVAIFGVLDSQVASEVGKICLESARIVETCDEQSCEDENDQTIDLCDESEPNVFELLAAKQNQTKFQKSTNKQNSDETNEIENPPKRARTENSRLEQLQISQEEMAQLDEKLFGTTVTIYGADNLLRELWTSPMSNEDCILKAIYSGDESVLFGESNSTKAPSDLLNHVSLALKEVERQKQDWLHSQYSTKSSDQFEKPMQPPLLEDLPLFPLLDESHGFRFPLYDYQRRLLYWMVQRERQSLMFEAWPCKTLFPADQSKNCLDSQCIPLNILTPHERSSDKNIVHEGHLKDTKLIHMPHTNVDEVNMHIRNPEDSHFVSKILDACQCYFPKDQSRSVTIDLSDTSDNIVFCNKNSRCTFADCPAMAQARFLAPKDEKIADGAQNAPLRMLFEAERRDAAHKDLIEHYKKHFGSNSHYVGSNPLLWPCGVSCGRTGCGKTTMKIALLYTMKLWEDQQPDHERERLVGENQTEYEALLPTHRRPLKLVKNIVTASTEESRKKLYYANCTMVVCPQQVVEQWFMEFVKTVGSGKARARPKTGKRRGVLNGGVFGEIVDDKDRVLLRIAVIRDIYGLRQVSLVDIIERLDVLIVHQNVFKSPSYTKRAKNPLPIELARYLKQQRPYCEAADLFSRTNSTDWIPGAINYERQHIVTKERELRDRMMSDGATDFDFNSVPKPGFALGTNLLHAIHFRRLIIDEAHLLSQHVTVQERAIADLHADFKWCVTATANFNVPRSMWRRVKAHNGGYGALLGVKESSDKLSLENVFGYRQQFVHQCSATTSFEALPPLRFHYIPVTMTAAESAIYSSLRSGQQTRMRRLLYCSHHMLNNAEWVEKNLSKIVSEESADVKDAKDAFSELMTVDQVASAMQSRRLSQIRYYNSSLLAMIDAFRQKWLLLRESTSKQIIELAEQTIDAKMQAKKQQTTKQSTIEDFIVDKEETAESIVNDENIRVDSEQPDQQNSNIKEQENSCDEKVEMEEECEQEIQPLSVDYMGTVDEEILDVWRNERDVRVCMEITRHDEELIRRGITLRSQYTISKKSKVDIIRARARIVSEYNFFENTFKRLSQPDEVIECPVCLDSDETKDSVVLTQCGHEFCPQCANSLFKRGRQVQCPVCRHRLVIPRDLRLVDRRIVEEQKETTENNEPEKEKKVETTEKQSHVRDVYGSKIEALIRLINRILVRRDCKKIVLFAQFQHLLTLIADVLRDNGVEFVMATGSIRSTERAFRAFRTDSKVRIILLSSEKSISGVHLIEANHLIAVHPTLCARGSEDEYAILWQAIGRIRRLMQTETCHVWQMVMQNSIEEELYRAQMAVARSKQAMDVGIVWEAAECEEDAARQQINQEESLAAKRRTQARQDIIKLLSSASSSRTKKRKAASMSQSGEDDDNSSENEKQKDDYSDENTESLTEDEIGEPLSDNEQQTQVEQEMQQWLSARK